MKAPVRDTLFIFESGRWLLFYGLILSSQKAHAPCVFPWRGSVRARVSLIRDSLSPSRLKIRMLNILAKSKDKIAKFKF